MSDSAALNVVLCWHMHQPEYRDLLAGEYQLPWTYLHAVKDYVDMAAHLERIPDAKAVVNFAPVLLEQLDDYSSQLSAYLSDSRQIRDPLLAGLTLAQLGDDPEYRLFLVNAALKSNKERLIARFPAYQRLASIANTIGQSSADLAYLTDQFIVDLLVWYHLAWMGETVRRSDLRVKRLMDKARGFSRDDRRTLLEIVFDVISQIVERYRTLHLRGQVELSVSPYAHPMLPLLLDPKVAREALPSTVLPNLEDYPGGEDSARWQIQQGIHTFVQHFGVKPAGCWPSEGGISTDTVALLGESGFRWVATGEGVIRHSLERAGIPLNPDLAHRGWRIQGTSLQCFFRSDELSDAIGFKFSDWHADDAVGHLLYRLGQIAESLDDPGERVVSIILDGENAWEHYPENGYHFLSTLYKRLAADPRFRLTTYTECVEAREATLELPAMVSGSWVYGNFATWIGSPDKNRGWEMLADAKRAFMKATTSRQMSSTRLDSARRQLAVCEGSDWFWWFGDENPSASVRDFDRLYRLHLSNLYRLIGVQAPGYLEHAFTRGGGAPELGGVMRRG